VDNGKPIRETMAADLPLAIDHFRYFAGVIRAEESSVAELDANTVSINIHEPIGVVGQIIPWNFPLLMATWKLAPAIAAGCTVVMKPAEQTPVGILVLMDLIKDVIPPGVVNIVTGFGPEAGKPLASSPRVAKVAFTGETTTGRLIMQYASENLNPVTMELGGKSPNIFMPSVLDADDDFFDKCLEGAAMFALNQGEVCTCPSRILVHESIYDRFIAGKMNGLAKIVFSKTLDKVEWENSTLVKENINETILKLKDQPGKDIIILGSGSIVSLFTQMGIIDEYRMIVNPVILGGGIPEFTGISGRKILELTDVKRFSSGVVILCYQPKQ